MTCNNCIHYNICSLWTTTDLIEDEAHKFCFGNFKNIAEVAPIADTVKKMQERLKKRLYDNPCLFTQQRYIVDADIDQIAKEMVEDLNESP